MCESKSGRNELLDVMENGYKFEIIFMQRKSPFYSNVNKREISICEGTIVFYHSFIYFRR